ncbi:LuxR C-terminal-related transcriptional regulator [Streptomyces sp. SID9727]|uniref:helix-turn-helix transcriptional regulator n=1 Tax=Streptomyces sp. SID9727 TaxID=2706114 RepID=UPI0013CAB272|nr:LuxR C-terminal-related transcriptional regulator [Streptomyces sp. SID9727]NEC68045.1 response regulator transcription factor [Streptomyces sp. SID9727]
MTAPHKHGHSPDELCDAAVDLYAQALAQGRIARSAAEGMPCLAEHALLTADPRDSAWLRPVPPTAALAHLLHPLARQVLDQVRAVDLLAKSLVPLVSASREPVLLVTLHGRSAIQASINGSAHEARDEILTIQPGSTRTPEQLQIALSGTLPTVARGVRVRHIYQHSARYSTGLKEYVAQLPSGLLEVRTVERAVDRLIVFDRTVAYLPADPGGSTALEIRHPALVRYLAAIYETLWAGATPFTQHLPAALPGAPVTAVQQSIARLLADGCTDQSAAEKLGISVRTCRAHIAKLMHTLNATSRTHLGALLVQSGLAEGPAGPVPPENAKRPATPGEPG